jgi:tetratricopeptide (TPR) repeat protein
MGEKTEGQEWVLLPLEPKMAKRQGLPAQVPVPKEKFEGLADEGLPGARLVEWIRDFFATAAVAQDGNWRRRNSELVSQLEGFVDKQPLWEKAQKLFGENQYEQATKTLRRITIMMPDDHAAKMNYASALANQGHYDKAYKQLKQIRESFEGEADFHVTVAQVQVARGDTEAAIEELLKALEAQPDHRASLDALAKLGVLSAVYEDPRNAQSLVYVRSDALEDYLKQLWDSEPRNVEFYLEQLGYHESERRFGVALEAAERAVAAAGATLSERGEQGKIVALRELGRLDDALAAARAFADKAPSSATAQVELSLSLGRAGREAEANAAVAAALERDPGDAMALVLRFWPDDRGDLMKVQAILPALAEWAEKHATSPGVWRSLARAKLVVGADEEALELFAKAVALSPADEDLRSEWWAELGAKGRHREVVADSEALGDMQRRDWRLRWNEAESYRALGRMMEARASFTQINMDESLHVDIRKRARRAAMELGMPAGVPGAPGGAPPPAG